jgi:hypothetical protein
MRKRVLAVCGGLAVLLVAVLAIVWYLWPDDRISPASCERIHEGMTRLEVEAILGGPPGAYTADGQDWSMGMLHGGVRHIGTKREVWVADDGGIRVDFDQQGRVDICQWCPRRQSFWQRLRDRIGW